MLVLSVVRTAFDSKKHAACVKTPRGAAQERQSAAAGSRLLFVTSRRRDAVEHHADVAGTQEHAGERGSGRKPARFSVGLAEVVHQPGEQQDTQDHRPQKEPAAEPSEQQASCYPQIDALWRAMCVTAGTVEWRGEA